ncbi:MAG: ATP-dependent DNA helicase RecG [Chitinophagales bacterium]|nr:ATP-dependent DNA helicase RecG [Chitinophagales bacterium]
MSAERKDVQFLNTPIEYLKGVGPEKATVLKNELQIFSFGDLIKHFPYRYVDRSQIHTTNDIGNSDTYIQLKGKIKNMVELGHGRAKRLSAVFYDDVGEVELVWFKGIQWIKKGIDANTTFLLYGKPTYFNHSYNIAHPELEIFNAAKNKYEQPFRALYNTTEKMKKKGLDSKAFQKLIANLLVNLKPEHIIDFIPKKYIEMYRMLSRYDAYVNIHQPKNNSLQHQAIKRLKFEELFITQINLVELKLIHQKEKGFIFEKIDNHFDNFYHHLLPFELTNAQKRVLKEIRKDMLSGKQMNRLLQGDVGSGKTIVALLCMLMAIDNNFQATLMAPTEILAQQHFQGIQELLQNTNINVQLLTGSTKSKEKKQILKAVNEGLVDLLIGTHALIEDTVQFKNLGIAIIDEQHRFGVEQRAKLYTKNTTAPHILVMTATPIPRTLAMTLYGDLDVSVIDELPPGRKPIKTIHKFESHRLELFGFMRDEIKKGRQIYIVYPLIQESEKLDLIDLQNGYEAICRAFPIPDYFVSVVHGKMKPADKDFEMQRFLKKETQIMVATTVIEVGVNVPNASVMIIENADRFGLSQLHQLRGRVGRGADQSYCILMTDFKLSQDAKKRIKTMCETNDGFKIAEVDLALRGPGNMEGTQQSGALQLSIANIATDGKILEEARKTAIAIYENDATLQHEDNKWLRYYLQAQKQKKNSWISVS